MSELELLELARRAAEICRLLDKTVRALNDTAAQLHRIADLTEQQQKEAP